MMLLRSTRTWNPYLSQRQFSSRGTADSVAALFRVNTNFDGDLGRVYVNRTTAEMKRNYRVLSLLSYPFLVSRNEQLNSLGQRFLPRSLYESLMRRTFYGQFVIGRSEDEARPIMERYSQQDGVNSILYYAMEEDHTEGESRMSNTNLYSLNVNKFKEAIDITSRATHRSGYIAVKPTALTSPQLWVNLTEKILQEKTTPNYHLELTAEESEELDNLQKRAEDVIQYSIDRGVGVMIDAEQTYFQPAIRKYLGLDMMEKFNKNGYHVVTTYQTYLKSAYDTLVEDIEYSKLRNFKLAVRLVRGAYLDQERHIAQSKGLEDPTNPSYSATSNMYNKTSDLLISELVNRPGELYVMFATHNEDAIRYIFNRLRQNPVSLTSIGFGQLYGMCEHISFHLGQCGIPVYKSMPYGEMNLVVSYLGRRAVENRGVLDRVQKETKLLSTELKRRKLRT